MSEDRIDSRRGQVYFKFNWFFYTLRAISLRLSLVISKRCQTGI